MNVLDFAIIGTPRAGTTSLHKWLNMHPHIHGSIPKETFFLMDANHPLAIKQKERGKPTIHTTCQSMMKSFFDRNLDGLRFESTTHNYYQSTARKVLSNAEKNLTYL